MAITTYKEESDEPVWSWRKFIWQMWCRLTISNFMFHFVGEVMEYVDWKQIQFFQKHSSFYLYRSLYCCKRYFIHLPWFQKGLVVQRLMMSYWVDLRKWQAILFITCYDVEYFSRIETCIKFWQCMNRGNHSIYTQDVALRLVQCMLDTSFLLL